MHWGQDRAFQRRPGRGGATGYFNPRSVGALTRWFAEAGINDGAVFRRVIVRRYAAKSAIAKQSWQSRSWNTRWIIVWEKGCPARDARAEYDMGDKALHPGSVTPIFREMLRRAFKAGAFGDLDGQVFEEQLGQISARSTRVGINQDYFVAGENLTGIMDALRWKAPRMPLLYHCNLAAEPGRGRSPAR